MLDRIVPSLDVPLRMLAGGLLLLGLGAGFLPSPAQGQRAAASPSQEFADAVEAFDQRLYEQAMHDFRAFRDAHPDHPSAGDALYYEARSALSLGREEEAVRLFRDLEQQYPAHPRAAEARLSLGRTFLQDGDRARGRRVLEEIAAESAGTPLAARALYLLGTNARERGDAEEALAYFERARAQAADAEVAAAAWSAAGATQLEMERYEEAAASFEALGEQFPTSPYAENLGTALAEVYYELGRYERAAEELRSRMESLSGQTRTRAVFLLAESYTQMRETEAAREQYRRLLDDGSLPGVEPYRRPARYGRAWNEWLAGRPAAAIPSFQAVRSGHTDDLALRATYHEAVAHLRTGSLEAARGLFRQVVDTWPQSRFAATAQYEIGTIAYRQQAYDEAAAAFRAVLRREGAARRGDAAYWLGNAYLAAGALDRALEAYNRAIRQDTAPDSLRDEVRFRKAWAHYREDDFEAAASAFSELASSPASSRSRDALFWGGDSFLQAGRLQEARRLLQRYVNEAPTGRHAAEAHYVLGWVHFKNRAFQRAADAFRTFLRRWDGRESSVPYEQDARLRLADSYYAQKRYGEAVDVYRRVDGDGADYALYQTGQALRFAGKPEEALATLQSLIDTYSNSPWRQEALYQTGLIAFQEGDYDAARSAYRRLLQAYPDGRYAARAQYGIGDAFYNAGTFDRAARAYQQVLKRYPDSKTATEAASSLFFALNAAGDSGRAEAVVDSFEAANPDSDLVGQLRFRRAEAAYQSGDRDDALRLFRSFTRTSSNDALLPQAYYYLGIIYADRGVTEEARTYLQQLVDTYPDSRRRPEAALRLGDLNLEADNHEAALTAYRTAAESDGIGAELQAQARYGQSRALLELGRGDAAEDLLRRIIDANRGGPLLASARLGLGRLYVDRGDPTQAIGLFRQVAESARSEAGAEALYRLGRLLREQGRPRDAIAELSRTSSLFAGYPEWVARSLLEQARAHRQLGQTGQANTLYDRVAREYSGTAYAETARAEQDAL